MAKVRAEVNASLEQLPHALRGAIVKEFAAPLPAVREATADVMEAFGGTEARAILLTRWGHDGPRKVAQIPGPLEAGHLGNFESASRAADPTS